MLHLRAVFYVIWVTDRREGSRLDTSRIAPHHPVKQSRNKVPVSLALLFHLKQPTNFSLCKRVVKPTIGLSVEQPLQRSATTSTSNFGYLANHPKRCVLRVGYGPDHIFQSFGCNAAVSF
jgi:hypothetical protein